MLKYTGPKGDLVLQTGARLSRKLVFTKIEVDQKARRVSSSLPQLPLLQWHIIKIYKEKIFILVTKKSINKYTWEMEIWFDTWIDVPTNNYLMSILDKL